MHPSPCPTIRGTPPAAYAGHCVPCALTHTLENDVELATRALERLFALIEASEGLAPLRTALAQSRGKMLGVLVAVDAGGARHELRAYSGELGGRRDWVGFVPPVIRHADTAALEEETLARVAALDRALEAIDVEAAQRALDEARVALREHAAVRREARSEGRPMPPAGDATIEAAKATLIETRTRQHALRIERREASQLLSRAIYDAVAITNAHGDRRPLRQVFAGTGVAGGTTDCAVPKLLEAANTARLRPIAIAEAWWGPAIGGRVHGEVQPPCTRKCLPILGFLLCDRG